MKPVFGLDVDAAIFMSPFPSKMDVGTKDSMLDIMSVRSSGLDCKGPISRLYLSSVCLLLVYCRKMVSSTTVNHEHLQQYMVNLNPMD